MFKDTRTYTDYNGVTRTEDFYFNFTEAEVVELELGTTGRLSELINSMIAAQDMPSIIKLTKELVLKAYGEKSPDGRRLVKSKELSEAYSQTAAYSQLFMELASDADKAAKFINAVLPNLPDANGKLTAQIVDLPTAEK